MHKRALWVSLIFVLAVAWCMSAYAADAQGGGQGFWDSVGGFLNNALPWNWGNWWGK